MWESRESVRTMDAAPRRQEVSAWSLGLLVALTVAARGGTIDQVVDPGTGWTMITANQGDISILVIPDAGCNVTSIQYQGTQMLRQPPTVKDARGFRYGVPLLYPTPNRVKGAKASLGGTDYLFEANDNGNFLHGLVHSAPFELVDVTPSDEGVKIVCRLDFSPGTPWFEKFPHAHALVVQIDVKDSSVRWTYTVDNAKGKAPVPYGFALHPWFLYQGKRAQTFLTIPATHLMESQELLPTGRLLELGGTKYDARQPLSLANFVVDDVYFGLRPEQPTVIDARDVGFEIGLYATADFTHLVVYTPDQEPYFCVENQTCSTDAFNLHERGKKNEAHLLFAETGGTDSGWVEYRFKKY